jgi:hypothetical protein
MAYIGKSPDGTGVRSRFYYTQTSGGGTSVSGSSDDGTTLAFSDGAYVDVFLNGVLLVAGTDYNTNTANTIAGLAALANGDVVEVVVYDIFTVADTVSALNGGTFSGAVGFSGGITGDLAATGHASVGVDAVDATRALTVAGSTDDSTASGLVVYNSSLASKFSVRNDGLITTAGNIQVGGDIRIGGTGSANALDDYEEGTFTPSFTSGVDGGATYSYQLGRYTKIGRQVIVEVDLDLNSFSANSSTVKIGTLPFSSDTSAPYGGGFFTYNGGFYNSLAAWFVANSASTAALYRQSDGAALAGNSSGMNMGATCRATIIYTAQ